MTGYQPTATESEVYLWHFEAESRVHFCTYISYYISLDQHNKVASTYERYNHLHPYCIGLTICSQWNHTFFCNLQRQLRSHNGVADTMRGILSTLKKVLLVCNHGFLRWLMRQLIIGMPPIQRVDRVVLYFFCSKSKNVEQELRTVCFRNIIPTALIYFYCSRPCVLVWRV